MVDGEIMGKQSSAKDMAQLQSSIDSMTVVGDSIGRQYYRKWQKEISVLLMD